MLAPAVRIFDLINCFRPCVNFGNKVALCVRSHLADTKAAVCGTLRRRRYRDVERLSAHILPVLERADEDADEWVKTICHLARQYVTTGVIDPTDSLGSSVLAAAIR